MFKKGPPTTARPDAQVAEVKKMFDPDRHLAITLINEEIGLSVGTIHTIVTEELAMRKVCAKPVPKVLCNGAIVVRQLLAKFSIVTLLHPPLQPSLGST